MIEISKADQRKMDCPKKKTINVYEESIYMQGIAGDYNLARNRRLP